MHKLSVLSILVLVLVSVTNAVVVETEYGLVEGREIQVDNGVQMSSVHEFRGIPYGKDTSGPRRFANPEPVDPWTETFQAFTPGDSCAQLRFIILAGSNPEWTNISENCLNLDIYTPDALAAPGTYPVMVWIYGGAYQQGANIQFPGHFLAQNDVVVVVINYRLGKFGFAYTGNAAAPGNAGLWDQRLGLEFVVNNIANFGGEPGKITVFGVSAGAGSTAMLMLSPSSKDLFQQAILQSGAETNIWVFNLPDSQPEGYIRQVAADLECSDEDDFAMVDCLRGKTMDDILVNASVTCTPGYFCMGMAPVVDGLGGFLPKTPVELRADGDIMTGPIMSGITKDDGSLLVSAVVPEALFGCCNRTYFEKALRERILRIWAPRLDNDTAEDAFQAIDWNYSQWPYIYENENNRQSFVRIMTDLAFVTPWDTQLTAHSTLSDSYGFVFDHRPDNSSLPEWMGTFHSAEMAYVWGYPMLDLNEHIRKDSYLANFTYNSADIDYSRYIQQLWTNFAKYGNPTPKPVEDPLGGSTVWLTFDLDRMDVLYLGKEQIENIQKYEQRNTAFWREYMDYVLNGATSDTNDLEELWILVEMTLPGFRRTTTVPGEMLSYLLNLMSFGGSEDSIENVAIYLEELYNVN